MTKTKLFWRRQLCMLFCVFLIFSAVFPPAFAESAVMTSASMYSYFETYSSSGYWVDIQTPAHWITDTGEVAYCLQTNKDNPSYSSYYTIDGDLVYDEYVLTGLRAILNNGYPADNGGFDDEAARYATANAIRFWMAENYCDGMPQYLNLNVNGVVTGKTRIVLVRLETVRYLACIRDPVGGRLDVHPIAGAGISLEV